MNDQIEFMISLIFIKHPTFKKTKKSSTDKNAIILKHIWKLRKFFSSWASQFENCWMTADLRQATNSKCFVLWIPAQSSNLCPLHRRWIGGKQPTPRALHSHSQPNRLTCAPSSNINHTQRHHTPMFSAMGQRKPLTRQTTLETRSSDAHGAIIQHSCATKRAKILYLAYNTTATRLNNGTHVAHSPDVPDGSPSLPSEIDGHSSVTPKEDGNNTSRILPNTSSYITALTYSVPRTQHNIPSSLRCSHPQRTTAQRAELRQQILRVAAHCLNMVMKRQYFPQVTISSPSVPLFSISLT